MRRSLIVLAAAGALLVAPAVMAATPGPMKYVTFHRPEGSGCVTTTGTKAAATATGIGWDGSHVLVSCWKDAAIDRYTPTGALVDVVPVTRLPGAGLGGLTWDANDGVWWACGLDPAPKNAALSKQVGYITPDGAWHAASIAPHGCVNNVTYRAGLIYADGAYAKSQATSTTVDVGTVTRTADGALQLPSKLADLHPTLMSPHTSGNLFSDTGVLEWQADQFGTTKTLWHDGTMVLQSSLRFEQLACDKVTGDVYVKWHNQNRFGVIHGFTC